MKIYSCTLNVLNRRTGRIFRAFNDPRGFTYSTTWIGHDFAKLSEAIETFTTRHDIGASEFSPGPVYDDEGNVVGSVSYNCKVWPPGHWFAGQEPLYDPSIKRGV